MLPPDSTPEFTKPAFIWADKTALTLTILAALIWAVAWWTAFLVIGGQGGQYLWLHYGVIGTELGAVAAMALWLVLRAIDFAAGASTWQLGVATAHRLEQIAAPVLRAWRSHLHMPQIAR